ncbi:hypothetical protein FWZ09_18700 [Escherichia coli]|nr:hypothetical protein [Escherichia coli]EFN4031348.1 hypothetical protein [Escherichia coli]
MHPQFLVWCLTFGAQFKNDGHYFCRAGGNRPDGLNEPVTTRELVMLIKRLASSLKAVKPDSSVVREAQDWLCDRKLVDITDILR